MPTAPRFVNIRNLLIIGVILVVCWLTVNSPLFHAPPPAGVHLTDLHSIDQFQKQFEADNGMTRLVLIYSPTCSLCRTSADWVEKNILEKYPHANLRVYAIWTNKLVFDSREQWNAAGLSDRRVIHLWDPQNIVGNWFYYQMPNYQGDTWDTYLLFRGEATWNTMPVTLVSAGATVLDEEETIAQNIHPLLQG